MPNPAASDAATEVDFTFAASTACTEMSPSVAFTPSPKRELTLSMVAAMSLRISLRASEMPIEMATPTFPNAAARAAAPATDVMLDVSLASSVMLSATTWTLPL